MTFFDAASELLIDRNLTAMVGEPDVDFSPKRFANLKGHGNTKNSLVGRVKNMKL